MKRQINVCGVTYQICHNTQEQDRDLVGSYGYCDYKNKIIALNATNSEYQDKITLRHELIHAFFDECGLSKYSNDETLVIFLELQLPKLFDICKRLDILER